MAVSAPLIGRGISNLPEIPNDARSPSGLFAARKTVAVVGQEWSSFFSTVSGRIRSDPGLLSRRFRLVGTVVAYSSRLTDERKAVLDEKQKGGQRVVSEGETFDGVSVVRILRDRVVLRSGIQEETLMVKFDADSGGGAGASASTGGVAQAAAGSGEGGASENRFGGRQVGENKWLFDRGPMLGYYSELMDNPERLVKVFDSFKPVYGPDRRVAGYRIAVEGEPDFFQAVGLREGDVVRSVNTMRMTSRRRAEFFIREFVDNRANSFSMDIERGGQTVNQSYEAKP